MNDSRLLHGDRRSGSESESESESESDQMVRHECHVYLFGDQTADINPRLTKLLATRDDPLLTSFLEQSFYCLRSEVARLPRQLRQKFPRFTSIADLLAQQRRGDQLNPALEKALVCIYQLGFFISSHTHPGVKYPKSPDALLLGLCTGALAAAAVSACSTVIELLPVAVETISLAFRTGLRVYEVRSEIEGSSDPTSGQSWSLAVSGIEARTAADILEQYSESKHLPSTSRPYVSARSSNGVTISGPPGVFAGLCESTQLGQCRRAMLPIHGPYHASHLFSDADIESILGTGFPTTFLSLDTKVSVVSSTTGSVSQVDSTLRSCLEETLRDILIRAIDWNGICHGVLSALQSNAASHVVIFPIGTNAAQMLCSYIQSSNDNDKTKSLLPVRVEDLQSGDSTTERSYSGRTDRSKIAIIGMSGRYPSAEDTEQFWNLLFNGLDVHKEAPAFHWDVKTHVDVTGERKNTSATPYGCWLDNPALFDARFFNMSPREAPQVDPAQRIALLTAYEAIEQAGIVPGATPSTQKDRVGVFYGVTSNDWMETNSAQNIDTYFIPGGNRAFIPGRINYFFKFSGPSYSVDTACSSSLAAIHVACNALWRGDIDTAIAGGTNVLTNPDFTAGLDRGHFLSRTGNCKTFDDSADGYCRGEGVGTVILKRLDDAIMDHDPIQGLILGAYTNHSADAESITRPHVGAQRAIFQKILNEAGVDPYDISYVEMHGTGTQAGDAGEMESVLDTFAPSGRRAKRREDQALYLGSAKANIGHGEAVSGVSSLAKVLLMMKNNTIPPHCGIKTTINHKFPKDLDERNVRIAKIPTPWQRKASQPRRVFVNNFSAAGGNTALLIEDAPSKDTSQDCVGNEDSRSHHLVAISAKCAASMTKNLRSMLAYIDSKRDDGQCSLAQLSYTTTARRIHHPHRVMVSGSNLDDIRNAIGTAIERGDGTTRAKFAPKMTYVFTGQGAQYAGMGRQIFESFSQFREDIYRLDRLCQRQGFPPILEAFMSTEGEISDHGPVVVQLATVCLQVALARLWSSWGIVPGAVVGHSLGEYAALNVAGILSDADMVYLVGKRAQMLQDRCTRGTHAMLAALAPLAKVETYLSGYDYEISCLNSPGEVVLGGTLSQIEEIRAVLKERGIKNTILKVPYAFHTSQVDSILDEFESVAASVAFKPASVPVLSPLLGRTIAVSETIGPDYVRRHCRETVNMLEALRSGQQNQVIPDQGFFLEFGPHPVVSGMVKATLGSGVTTLSTLRRNKNVWQSLTEALSSLYTAGVDIQWAEYHRDFESCHNVLPLPAYGWDLKEYWMQYVNDWSLRKGDPVPSIAAPCQCQQRLATTTVHRVVNEEAQRDCVDIVVESDISRPDLNPLVQGHKVNGIPLCTPSVYADIALTVGKYLLSRYQPAMSDRVVDVANMTIEKALIAKAQGPQLLQTFIRADWKSNTAHCAFCSVDDKGQVTAQHATCQIQFPETSSYSMLKIKQNEIKSRMEELRSGIVCGRTFRFNSKMVYKMVATLANFHPDYRGIDEVILDSENLEACGRVDLKNVKEGGNFTIHPAYVDGLTQLGGFVMNANDNADLDTEVFVNHGWKSCQLFEEVTPTQVYHTHVKMVEKEKKMWEGDVTVFHGDRPVAIFGGVVLQGVPRKLLHYILAAESGKSAAPASGMKVQSRRKNDKMTMERNRDTAPSRPDMLQLAMQIISEESGIAPTDFGDANSWADMGVDSLLALTVSSRFREEIGLDFDSSQFIDLPTVGSFKEYLRDNCSQEDQVPSDDDSGYAGPENLSTEPCRDEQFQMTNVLEIISEESGVAVVDLTDDSSFADMGIDSLLSLVISSRLREELGLDIDGDSLFIDCPTVSSLRMFLSGSQEEEHARESPICEPGREIDILPHHLSIGDYTPSGKSSAPLSTTEDSEEASGITTPLEDTSDSGKSPFSERRGLSRMATSVILQGLPSNTSKTLILFPDGAGSCSSYAALPRISPDTCVIGLNCPFVRSPEEMSRHSLDDLMDMYLAELRRRQPNGPYDLGGWSAGGILAFRAAQLLLEQGEEVLSLVLIDSPVPHGLDRLPQRFYDHLREFNVFGHAAAGDSNTTSAGPPEWLIPHFNATIDMLENYYASPLLEGTIPKTTIVWATESVIDGVRIPKLPPHPDDTEGMKFLTEPRTDFSAAGWEELFPGQEVVVERVDGANHFSLMRGEHAPSLVKLIDQAMT